jgi:hypothetical protein
VILKGLRTIAYFAMLPLIASCATVEIRDDIGVTAEATPESYVKNKSAYGVVLLDARWARQWRCATYENAQLVSFSFDRMPLVAKSNDAKADILIGSTSQLTASQKFESYALLVPPGEYALSGFKIKVAKSVSDVGYWVANRSDVNKNEAASAGKFLVAPGEAVYIGNFALDCYQVPTLWRYHSDGKDAFEKQIADYRSKYPFLDLSNVKFRLFETTTNGRPYVLP